MDADIWRPESELISTGSESLGIELMSLGCPVFPRQSLFKLGWKALDLSGFGSGPLRAYSAIGETDHGVGTPRGIQA